MFASIKKVIRLYEKGNVCLTGLRGCGKDLLQGNVIIRRNLPYISNVNYGGEYIPYDYASTLALNGNSFKNFIDGKVNEYVFPFNDGTDIYLSDVGVYFPSQECSYLDKNYKGLPLFMAISRHLGLNVHANCQRLMRYYTKMREQSDIYIRTEWVCKWLLKHTGIVVQKITIYSKDSSCEDFVPPCPYKVPLFAPRESKELYRMKITDYTITYGEIKSYYLIYKNKCSYDDRHFRKLLGGDLIV